MTMTNLREAADKTGPLNIAERTCQTAQMLQETVLQFLKTLSMELTPSNATLSCIYKGSQTPHVSCEFNLLLGDLPIDSSVLSV